MQRQISANNSHVGATKSDLFVLVCTFFLGRIGLLSKTASSQPSQQGKEGLDGGVCTNSSMTLRNCAHHWIGLGGGGLNLRMRRGMSHIGDFDLTTNFSLFFLGLSCILCWTPQNLFFLVGNEYHEVKKTQFTPYLAIDLAGPLCNLVCLSVPRPFFWSVPVSWCMLFLDFWQKVEYLRVKTIFFLLPWPNQHHGRRPSPRKRSLLSHLSSSGFDITRGRPPGTSGYSLCPDWWCLWFFQMLYNCWVNALMHCNNNWAFGDHTSSLPTCGVWVSAFMEWSHAPEPDKWLANYRQAMRTQPPGGSSWLLSTRWQYLPQWQLGAGPRCSVMQGPHAGLESVTAQDGCLGRNHFHQNSLICLEKTSVGFSSTVD